MSPIVWFAYHWWLWFLITASFGFVAVTPVIEIFGRYRWSAFILCFNICLLGVLATILSVAILLLRGIANA